MIGIDALNCTSLVNLTLHGYFVLITQEIDESNDRIDISTKITFLPKSKLYFEDQRGIIYSIKDNGI